MLFGLAALFVGITMIVIGTRFRSSVAASVLVIVGGTITKVSVIFIGFEGMHRES